jgi:formylglycine-generating enzyme required for sulfatase activity
VTRSLDQRLSTLQTELADHARIARRLGLDFERPIRSLGDGYPENTVALVGKIAERLLKQLWIFHEVPGDPNGKALNDLIKGCRPHVRSTNVINALTDIQRLRNRSTHDGYDIAEEDGLLAIRRLIDVLSWFATTRPSAMDGDAPALDPLVERKAEFLAGLYSTLGYRTLKRFELSECTVYHLFCWQSGLRMEYVEVLISRSLPELTKLLATTGGELLRTRLPKLTRFLVVDDEPATERVPFGDGEARIVAYERFVETIVDVPGHLGLIGGAYPQLPAAAPAGAVARLTGEVLETDQRTGEMRTAGVDDAVALLAGLTSSSANVLLIGGPGSGKTTLLKRIAVGSGLPGGAPIHRYRFYLDLSLKLPEEDFGDFVTRLLAPHMTVPHNRVFDVFLYLIRTGSVLCVLDAVDEAVTATSLTGFLDLFTEVAQTLSAESTVLMSSRYPFLADSPQVRRLLNGASLISEQLVQQLHANGVDPLELPHFSVVRLLGLPSAAGAAEGMSPLELRLAAQTARDAASLPADPGHRLTELVSARIDQVLTAHDLTGVRARLDAVLGRGFLADRTVFSLAELCTDLGVEVFAGSRVAADTFLLADLFRPAGPSTVTLEHSVFAEYLAACYLRTASGRADAATIEPEPLLTEQVRRFLTYVDAEPPAAEPRLVPAGAYVVGPAHRLLLRALDRPILVDEHPVTVGSYRQFLAAVARDGCAAWDHPDTPADHTHEPWQERLREPRYFTDPRFEDYPVNCVTWWSAYAFAAWAGRRLPTCTEWEVAARGADGRLFPWGDDLDLAAVNCADTWSGRPLVTFEAWKQEIDSGRLHAGRPTPITAHPANVSPFGVRGMAGNVWEWTATVFEDINSAAICGGSYDNPARAVQASSHAWYRRRGSSNAVGFRCVQDLP